jgi:uncharacterized protein (TIGR00369 family)
MPGFDVENPEFESAVRESFGRLALMKTLGATLERVATGEVDIAVPFREDLSQHHGFMAAAVLTAIVDVAGGYAAMTLMPAGTSVLTVEYKVNFLAPARGERMVARARVIRPGRTVTTCAGDVFAVAGGSERIVATMLATMMQVTDSGGRTPAAVDAAARRGSPAAGPGRVHARSRWCVCGGRGLRRRLRDIRWRIAGNSGLTRPA